MTSNSEYRNRACASLQGNWGEAAVLTIIFYIITGGVTAVLSHREGTHALFIVAYFLLFPLYWGFETTFLNLSRGAKIDFSALFYGYKDFLRIAVTYLLRYIYTVLWTFLLVIPGIIKAYSYSMTPFILKDDSQISNNRAIEKSMAMMEGHKMQLFLLDLSFIGWAILCVFTLGIGFLFLAPYVETAHAKFYEDLKADTDWMNPSFAL